MSNYYCLVAGLPELSIDDNKLSYSIASFKQETYPLLSRSDRALFDLFFNRYDNSNLLAYLKDKEAVLDERAMLSALDLAEVVAELKENEESRDSRILPYMRPFIEAYVTEKPFIEGALWNDQLATLYYDYAIQCKNSFFAAWFTLNLNINNLLVAFSARKYGMEVAPLIIGDNDVAHALRTSTARDFGLSATIDYLEAVSRLSDESDVYERERKVDMLRWKWIDENTFFDYFSIERVFAFLLKVDMLERWLGMDSIQGEAQFKELFEQLKREVTMPDEFKI